MSNLKPDPEAVEIIRQAIDDGREVIPFLGAGLSAGSGFPLITEIRDYLCKVRFLIETGVYRYLLGESAGEAGKVKAHSAGSPQYNPARYIDCFGWPGINQLDADLSSYIQNTAGPADPARWINELIGPSDGTNWGKPGLNWGVGRWSLRTAVLYVILKQIDFHDTALREAIADKVRGLELKPRIDWFRYLLDLSGGRRGLIDTLFAQLNARREPSLGHIMLAHLAREFGWRFHLTINFDNLLETAFRRERLAPEVFEVVRDSQPPDPKRITNAPLALLKLHGGSYDIRIGEPLDHELDSATREHVFASVPSDALLLVLGFSGDERRMMQLIEDLVLRPGRDAGARDGGQVRLLWMHWEKQGRLPKTMTQLRDTLTDVGRRSEFHNERLSDAGTFLLQTYQHLTNTLPTGALPYSALPKHVLSSKKEDEPATAADREKIDQDTHEEIGGLPLKPIHLFARESLRQGAVLGGPTGFEDWMPRPGLVLDDNPSSRQMSRFVQTLGDYHLIWIDLEDHHTLAGIVGEIIGKMRTFDPHLSDLVLPFDDKPESLYPSRAETARPRESGSGADFDKPVRFIVRALKRGRYTLAFDSLEGYGREQTGHHGLPWHVDEARSKRLVDRHETLIEFLKSLIVEVRKSEIDWCCCISADEPSYRHVVPAPRGPNREGPLDKIRDHIIGFCDFLLVGYKLRPVPLEDVAQTLARKSVLVGADFVDETLRVHIRAFDARGECVSDSDLMTLKKANARPLLPSEGKLAELSTATATATTEAETPWTLATASSILGRTFLGTDDVAALTRDVILPTPVRPWSEGCFSGRESEHRLERFCEVLDILNEMGDNAKSYQETLRKTGFVIDGPSGFESVIASLLDDTVAEPPDALAAFFVLAAFRRPRCIAAVHAVLREFFLGRAEERREDRYETWLKGVLAELQGVHLLRPMDGGYFWILHHAHEWTYKLQSEPARWQYFMRAGGTNGTDAPRDFAGSGYSDWKKESLLPAGGKLTESSVYRGEYRINRLILLTSVHSRIARSYYMDIFKRSKDITGMYEYIYHRITSVNYITTLREALGAIPAGDGPGLFAARARIAGRIGTLIEREGVATPGEAVDVASMRRCAESCRDNFLRRLLNVLIRDEQAVLSSGTADTWLAWIGTLKHDIERYDTRYAVGAPDGPAAPTLPPAPKQKRSRAVTDRKIDPAPNPSVPNRKRTRVRAELDWKLRELEVRLYREKGARKKCIEAVCELMITQCNRCGAMLEEFGQGAGERLPQEFAALLGEWRLFRVDYQEDQKRREGAEELPKLSALDIMEKCNYFCDRFFVSGFLRQFFDLCVKAHETDKVDRALWRFFWCYRQSYTCLRHDPECQARVEEWMNRAERWMIVVNGVIGDAPDVGILPDKVRKCFRQLATGLKEQEINLKFDRQRFLVERKLSRPFTRPRFTPFGQKRRSATGADVWEIAEKIRRDVDADRNSAFGIMFVRERRLFRSQCEMRTLAAQSSAFLEDFDAAFRELNLSLSGLDPVDPKDRFLCAVVLGITAEVHLLKADSLVRRRYCDEIPEGRTEHARKARSNRSHAFKQLSLASTALDAAETHLRAVRPNVSRWEWLYEIRAQLVIERVLLRAVDLDFEIDPPADDWRFIGALQQDMAEGLEAIRAGIDCTMQPWYGKAHGQEAKEYDLSTTYQCLVSLWLQLMTASFWVFRVFSMNAVRRPQVGSESGLAPLLGTVQMFDTHGSRPSFTKRWHALNRAAGLSRYTVSASDSASGAPDQPKAWDWAKEALELPNRPPDFYVTSYVSDVDKRTLDDHPAFLREFILEKTRRILEEKFHDKKSIFQLFLDKVSKRFD